MSLLREIQNAAVDQNTDVATLLRKCKILAVRLGNEEFKKWVDNELNGYDNADELPEYRIFETESYGTFVGPFGSSMQNVLVPPICLPEELREKATKSYLMQPISWYSSLLTQDSKNNAIEPWPANMVALFAKKIYRNYNCLAAWKLMPYSAIVSLIDTIKTRILNFSLEIEGKAPDAGEAPPNKPPLPQEQVSQVFHTHIHANVIQNVATGSSNVTQSGEFTVSLGDFESLNRYLRSFGMEENDIKDLRCAIDEDAKEKGEPTFGHSVRHWVGQMIGKAASGAWQVGISAAGTLLGKALEAYFVAK